MNKAEASYYDHLNEFLKDPEAKRMFEEEMLKLEIAAEIRKLRKKKKISQSELAKKINTTQAVISRIENAQVYPSTDIIQRICNTFKVRVKFKFC